MNGYSTVGALDRQSDLLTRLQNVVRQLNRPDIRTVSDLFAKVIGDQKWGFNGRAFDRLVPTIKESGRMGLQILAGLERRMQPVTGAGQART